MISLKRYLDATHTPDPEEPAEEGLLPSALSAYRAVLGDLGDCSVDVCPSLGDALKKELATVSKKIKPGIEAGELSAASRTVRTKLDEWTQKAIDHGQQNTKEVKEILLVMARTAESVGERDTRAAEQITSVTAKLKAVANLDDLSQMRAAIERSASELKTSIDRMTSEGKAAITQLKTELTSYQNKLEEAEKIASRDSLTGLVVRRCIENQIERRIGSNIPFCVAVLDVNGFKQVNDVHGHLVGDELLKQFAGELRSRSRTTDLIGRWGGDEFIIVMDCDLEKAQTQIDRLKEWVCGNYTLQSADGPKKLAVSASIGVAEHKPREEMKSLLHRADTEMYKQKAASRAQR